MRHSFTTIALAAALLIASSTAQELPVTPGMREAALENLLSERGDPKQLDKAITAARQNGVSEQAILEARFLYYIDLLDDAAIAAMLPDFVRQQDRFQIEDSAIFAVEEDWLAVVEYVKAIAALQNNDKQGFKEHIKEAFWLGPRQAAAFAPHIERLRHEEAMRAITIDFNIEVTQLANNQALTLATLIKDHKALLLHFWSPKSSECAASLPDFALTCLTLEKHGIAIASLAPEATPDAIAMATPYTNNSGLWAVDSSTNPLGRLLRVQNLPTMTLVSTEGKILFSGDPTDHSFWKKLRSIDKSITRPETNDNFGR